MMLVKHLAHCLAHSNCYTKGGWRECLCRHPSMLISSSGSLQLFFFFNKLIFIGVQLIYTAVLVSAVQQSESIIHILYIYPLFFRFYSHIGHYRVLSRVPCAILLYSRSLLFVCFIYSSVYMSIPISQLIPPPLTPW